MNLLAIRDEVFYERLTCLNCNGQKWRKVMLQRRQNGLREGRITERSVWERYLCLCTPSFWILWVTCRYHTLVIKVHWLHIYPTLNFRIKHVLSFCLLWSQLESSFFSGIWFWDCNARNHLILKHTQEINLSQFSSVSVGMMFQIPA